MAMPFNRQRPGRRFIFFPVVAIFMLLLLSLVVMLLWNAILPDVLHAGRLQYGQAIGLLILCRILFGGFGGPFRGRGGRPGGPPWRDKWVNMTSEEQRRFREEWQRRCRPEKAGNNEHHDPERSRDVEGTPDATS
jgi:hypothetical protein